MSEDSSLARSGRRDMGALAGQILLFSGVILMWLLLVSQARYHWGAESYYNYGPAVPFAALYLLYKRWVIDATPWTSNRKRMSISLYCVLLPVILLIPLQLLSEVNPFWRVPLLGQATIMVFVSLLLVYGLGGKTKLWHYSLPVLFLFLMLPWPWRIEVQIIQGFSRQVVAVTVSVLQFLGHPAVHLGNTIQIGEVQVGVDDACSGIRSLQALGMAAFFLGEFFLMAAWRRLTLIGITLGLVFVFNSIRSLTLTLILLYQGNDAYHQWHDWVGILTYVCSILFLYLSAELLNAGKKDPPGEKPKGFFSVLPKVRPVPAAIFLSSLVLVMVFVEGWFRYHESRSQPLPDWELDWPQEESGRFEYSEFPEVTTDALGFDYSRRLRYVMTPDAHMDLFFYGYEPENRLSSVSSYGHSPIICMQASGAQLVKELEPLTLFADGLEVVMQHAVFTYQDRIAGTVRVHTFWCVWERQNMGMKPEQLQSLDFTSQWAQLMAGRRDYSRQVLLAAVYGVESVAQARTAITQTLRDSVPIKTVPVSDTSDIASK